MSPLLSQDAAEALLAPHLLELSTSMRDAVKRCREERGRLGPVSARTRACLINDYASENAERLLAGRPGVELIRTEDETLIMIFEDRAIVRIKKLNSDLQISFIPTGQAKLWAAQQPLDGFPEATNLVAGYTLDEVGDLDRLLLICSKHNRRLWALDLDDTDGMAMVLEFPEGAPGPGRATVRSNRTDVDTADDQVSE